MVLRITEIRAYMCNKHRFYEGGDGKSTKISRLLPEGLLGMLLTSELVGFFIIVMFSMTDVFLQNPIGNPSAYQPFLEYFPSYSAMQLSVAGGFTHVFAGKQVLPALGWFLSFLVLSLIVFSVRTRRRGGSVELAVQDPKMRVGELA